MAGYGTANLRVQERNNGQLLHAREVIWRVWFANDTQTLEKMVPPESIVISSGQKQWSNQADVLRHAAEFHAKGGRLIRLEFPRTEHVRTSY